ncbi:MAG: hypothetical protein OEO79_12710 [Gemmatimonadota bacterium]|nr:hypothetical protein [Gemmatimonadota bacterium]
MKRTFVLTLALLVAPTLVAAQWGVALEAVGLQVTSIADQDSQIDIGTPGHMARVWFAAGDQLTVETRVGLGYGKQGDSSGSTIELLPGVNFHFNDQFYVRGQAGLWRQGFDNGTTSGSVSQYAFGGALGTRRAIMGGPVSWGVEAGVTRWLENTDDFIPAETIFELGLLIDAQIGG